MSTNIPSVGRKVKYYPGKEPKDGMKAGEPVNAVIVSVPEEKAEAAVRLIVYPEGGGEVMIPSVQHANYVAPEGAPIYHAFEFMD